MLGSAENASALLKDLSDFAAKTPFTMPSIVSASKQLLAYGFGQEEIIETSRRLGDISAALGINIQDLSCCMGRQEFR
jgi:hypothetical protein